MIIILSNGYAKTYHNPDEEKSISAAIEILRFCGREDKQAERVLYIVENFRDVILNRSPHAMMGDVAVIPTLSRDEDYDPVAQIFNVGSRHDGAQSANHAQDHLHTLGPSMREGFTTMSSGPDCSNMAQNLQYLGPEDMPAGMNTLGDGSQEFDFAFLRAIHLPATTMGMAGMSDRPMAGSSGSYGGYSGGIPDFNQHVPAPYVSQGW